jgi:hypothetical protein
MRRRHGLHHFTARRRTTPSGEALVMRGCGTPDGGLMLIVGGRPSIPERPPPANPRSTAAERAEERPTEW